MADSPLTGPLEIRPLVPGDLDEVFAIEASSFSAPWSLRTFHGELATDERFRILVAREAGSPGPGPVSGYAAFFDLGEEYHLIALAVRPELRRRGVGRRLMDAVTNLADAGRVSRVTLEVRAARTDVAAFYEAVGFIPVALRAGYYEDTGEDGLVMWRVAPAAT